MTTTVKLTQLETIALADLWVSSYGSGHDFGFTDELPSIAKPSRGGVVGSLATKGFIASVDVDMFAFTDAGKALFVDFEKSSELA